MALSLRNKIVFITGASSGIGAACARVFAAAGAKLILCARRKDRLDKLAAELRAKLGTESLCFELDVTNRVQVREQISASPEAWRQIQLLINNAGLAAGLEKVQEADIDNWEQMIDVNLKGLLYVAREVIPLMLKRDIGHIINIASIAGYETYSGGSVYCATKHAVRALSWAFEKDLLGTGIRCSTVSPGACETEFSLVRFKGNKERADQVYQGMRPLTPDDIAEAVYFTATRPAHVNVNELLIMAADQAGATEIYRRK